MKLIKLTITLDSSLVDSLSDFLIGVHDSAIELSVTDGDGPVTLQAFAEKDVSSIDEVESVIAQVREYGFELAQIFACDPPKITVEFLEDRDWSESWKVHFKPFAIVPGLVIAPSWEKYEPAPDEKVIVMDPGMAFGTGHHETTRLCLEVLSQTEAVVKGGTMLDVGTGTGILAMASVLFGARHAVGIDNDTEAVKAARDNCRLNSLSEKIEISDRPLEDIESTFDLVVANIVHDVLLELSKDLGRVASGGSLLLSGLMDGNQSENIIHCFVDKGFQLIEKHTDDHWCALLFDKAV
ncbi:MAG: 50S ribosomal protein L11 methyltransferase [Desulfofustis sp.]|nr:50S ribosomal protein L11 methyltransferase [Desulfofustis sp.]